MKLNASEKFVLTHLLKNPKYSNAEISTEMGITPQAIGKIRKNLEERGIIKKQELILDYGSLGVDLHAIALIKVLPTAFNKFKHNELDKVLKPINAIRSYSIPETDITHIIIYAFRTIGEYDKYFRNLLKEFSGFVEIKHSFVFSSESIIKSSSRDLFTELLNNHEN